MLGRFFLIATISICAAACTTAPDAEAQDIGKILSDVLHQKQPGDANQLSKGDVVAGLKEALDVSADRAAARLGARNGFFQDPQVRIELPGALGDAQKRLKSFGMAGPLDDLQAKLNQGAEKSMPTAKRLVVDAVKSMTIDDALGVLRGGETAATDLLRSKTETSLRSALQPYVRNSLDEVGALSAVDAAVIKYGAGLVKSDARTWLTDHAVEKGMDGLFYYLAVEERAIRRDPVKRTSEILVRVFGG